MFVGANYTGEKPTNRHFSANSDFVLPANFLSVLSSMTLGSAASFGHIVDPGTDLLVLLVLGISSTSQLISGATWAGTGMTLLTNIKETNSYKTAALFCLSAPAQGSGTVSITLANGTEYRAVAINLLGSQASSPVRDYNSVTTITGSVTTVVDDLVFSAISNNNALTPASGQTVLWSGVWSNAIPWYFAMRTGAAGTTPDNWSGTASWGIHSAMSVKGS